MSTDLPRLSAPLAARSPLWAILTLSWVSSLGTGVATNGIYFMTKEAYGFSVAENYALGFFGGLTYILGAISAGPLLRWLSARFGIGTRAALAGILALLALLCLLPMTFASRSGELPAHWPMWALMLSYQPLTGILWPIVERYLSGGRSGAELRSALGQFNMVWSSALVLGLWGMGPYVEKHAPAVLAILAVVHIASVGLLLLLGREPGIHLEGDHDPHPPVYAQLLTTFRILLPTSYLVLTALSPYLPTALAELGVDKDWRTRVAATWTAGRFFTFFVLERWHGWHGRWYPAVVGVILLLGGFAASVLAPKFGSGVGLPMMIAGLAAFGVGMATIYTAALYYAMEVERSQVEAGGRHEALIGLGYTGGPICGLAGGLAVSAHLVAPGSGDLVTLGLVGIVAVSVCSATSFRILAATSSKGNLPHV